MSIVRPSRTLTYSVEATVENTVYTLYTCPDHCHSLMSLLFVSNADGNTTVNISWNRADGQHIAILGGKNMTSGEYVKFDGAYIVFNPGDYMTVQATGNAAPHMDALCTVEEIFNQSGNI